MDLGVVFIPIASSLPDKSFINLIPEYNPKLIFLFHEFALAEEWRDKVILFDNERENNIPDKLYFSEWLMETMEPSGLPELSESDIAIILHTSGSSGAPKGVLLTHGQLFQSALNMVSTYRWDNNDRYFSFGHLDSMSGLRNACIVTAESGSSCILPSADEKRNIRDLLASVYESGTTILIASPSLLNQFLMQKDVKNLTATVRLVLSTGSKLSSHLRRSFFERTNKHIINYYGLTETTGFCIGEPLDTHHFDGNCIGNAVDCVLQIVDENKNKVKSGEVGELRIHGYCVSNGYWNGGDATGIHERGWFYTGDLAKVDATGGIELIGRKTEFIKTARSEIVFMKDIEEAIEQLPFIIDTYATSYFQDEAEKIALFLETNENLTGSINVVERVVGAITDKIGADKIPSQIRVIDRIPRNENGKVLRNVLEKYL